MVDIHNSRHRATLHIQDRAMLLLTGQPCCEMTQPTHLKKHFSSNPRSPRKRKQCYFSGCSGGRMTACHCRVNHRRLYPEHDAQPPESAGGVQAHRGVSTVKTVLFPQQYQHRLKEWKGGYDWKQSHVKPKMRFWRKLGWRCKLIYPAQKPDLWVAKSVL